MPRENQNLPPVWPAGPHFEGVPGDGAQGSATFEGGSQLPELWG